MLTFWSQFQTSVNSRQLPSAGFAFPGSGRELVGGQVGQSDQFGVLLAFQRSSAGFARLDLVHPVRKRRQITPHQRVYSGADGRHSAGASDRASDRKQFVSSRHFEQDDTGLKANQISVSGWFSDQLFFGIQHSTIQYNIARTSIYKTVCLIITIPL